MLIFELALKLSFSLFGFYRYEPKTYVGFCITQSRTSGCKKEISSRKGQSTGKEQDSSWTLMLTILTAVHCETEWLSVNLIYAYTFTKWQLSVVRSYPRKSPRESCNLFIFNFLKALLTYLLLELIKINDKPYYSPKWCRFIIYWFYFWARILMFIEKF